MWHRLREQGPVLPGILHELTGCTEPMFFHGLPYPDSPHFTVFDYDTCMTAYRNPEVFASSPGAHRPRQRSTGPDQQHAVDGRRRSTSAIAHLSNRRSCRRTASGGSTIGSPRPWTCSSTGSRTTDTPNSTSTSARPSRCSPSPAASACPSSRPSISGKRSGPIRRRSSTSSSRSSRPAARSRRTT